MLAFASQRCASSIWKNLIPQDVIAINSSDDTLIAELSHEIVEAGKKFKFNVAEEEINDFSKSHDILIKNYLCRCLRRNNQI